MDGWMEERSKKISYRSKIKLIKQIKQKNPPPLGPVDEIVGNDNP